MQGLSNFSCFSCFENGGSVPVHGQPTGLVGLRSLLEPGGLLACAAAPALGALARVQWLAGRSFPTVPWKLAGIHRLTQKTVHLLSAYGMGAL
jgi:hypothetical protein